MQMEPQMEIEINVGNWGKMSIGKTKYDLESSSNDAEKYLKICCSKSNRVGPPSRKNKRSKALNLIESKWCLPNELQTVPSWLVGARGQSNDNCEDVRDEHYVVYKDGIGSVNRVCHKTKLVHRGSAKVAINWNVWQNRIQFEYWRCTNVPINWLISKFFLHWLITMDAGLWK